jgi:Na+/melibiose symporter-like transporter
MSSLISHLPGCAGGMLVLVSCGAFYLLTPTTGSFVYGGATILGVGSTVMMVTSHSMANDLVGEYGSCGAFVYGAFSLTDKLANGVLILGVQTLKESACPVGVDPADMPDCATLVRHVLCFLPAAAVLLSVAASWAVRQESPPPQRFSKMHKGVVYSSFAEPVALEDEVWSDWVI